MHVQCITNTGIKFFPAKGGGVSLDQFAYRVKKIPDLDSWYYASVVDSGGIEIGRVMVVRSDRKKMVSYLSELFGVS